MVGRLEDDPFLLELGLFSGANSMLVCERVTIKPGSRGIF